jgi:hypothetical protein
MHAGVVFLEAVVLHKAGALLVWQFGQFGPDAFDVLAGEFERQQVGIGEVAVIVRLFLRAHGARLVLVGVVQAGFLIDLAAVLKDIDLAAGFVFGRHLDEAERVDVLDLAARAEMAFEVAGFLVVIVAAGRQTETFTSARRLPFSMSPSQVPSAMRMDRSFFT